MPPGAVVDLSRMMRVRRAVESDIPWLLDRARDHSKMMGQSRPVQFTDDFGQQVLAHLIDKHVVLVARDKDDIQPCGFIVGQIGVHPFDQSINVLSEILWWVDPGFKGRRAAVSLVREYIRVGEIVADWVICSHLYDPKSMKSALVKRGFRELERAFLMEV